MLVVICFIDHKVQAGYILWGESSIRSGGTMQFGNRVRQLRIQNGLTQQMLALRLGVSVSYISKVENEKLHFGDYPSEKFIHKLAETLSSDEDELLVLTNRVPKAIQKRVRERPDAFRAFASLDDATMDSFIQAVGGRVAAKNKSRKKVRK